MQQQAQMYPAYAMPLPYPPSPQQQSPRCGGALLCLCALLCVGCITVSSQMLWVFAGGDSDSDEMHDPSWSGSDASFPTGQYPIGSSFPVHHTCPGCGLRTEWHSVDPHAPGIWATYPVSPGFEDQSTTSTSTTQVDRQRLLEAVFGSAAASASAPRELHSESWWPWMSSNVYYGLGHSHSGQHGSRPPDWVNYSYANRRYEAHGYEYGDPTPNHPHGTPASLYSHASEIAAAEAADASDTATAGFQYSGGVPSESSGGPPPMVNSSGRNSPLVQPPPSEPDSNSSDWGNPHWAHGYQWGNPQEPATTQFGDPRLIGAFAVPLAGGPILQPWGHGHSASSHNPGGLNAGLQNAHLAYLPPWVQAGVPPLNPSSTTSTSTGRPAAHSWEFTSPSPTGGSASPLYSAFGALNALFLWIAAGCVWMVPILWGMCGYFLHGLIVAILAIGYYCFRRSCVGFVSSPSSSSLSPSAITDSDLEIQTGVLQGQPYAAVFASTTRPQYLGQIRSLPNPRPGMRALQCYINWRQAHAFACNLPRSQR